MTTFGEEVKFGGGKIIRDGMGQSQMPRAGGAVDTVITNALIVDHTGIYKADVALKGGLIHAIGKAGNPDTQSGVDIIIGPGTEIIAGEGRILTAGGIDSHIHFIASQQMEDALHSGVTTCFGGGTGPAHGTLATTCTPGPWHIGRMLQAFDGIPMNLGLAGKGNASQPQALEEMVRGGACALKLHEDWEACMLSYDARFLRRKVVKTVDGQSVLVDLPKTTSLNHGDAPATAEGKLIEIIAVQEAVLQVTGPNLVLLAWHIGNRHIPCQIGADHLLIQNDPVIGHMLEHLGAKVTPVQRPFTPEGGAYGHGRTHSHEHGNTAHDRRHADLELVLIESGGDNLSATFSPELAGLTLYVIDVAAGEEIPRKGGPAITKSDLLVINKTDLAPHGR